MDRHEVGCDLPVVSSDVIPGQTISVNLGMVFQTETAQVDSPLQLVDVGEVVSEVVSNAQRNLAQAVIRDYPLARAVIGFGLTYTINESRDAEGEPIVIISLTAWGTAVATTVNPGVQP